jgi:hypothetical protein
MRILRNLALLFPPVVVACSAGPTETTAHTSSALSDCPPGQTLVCTPTEGASSLRIEAVTCACGVSVPSYEVTGMVTGLTGSGLTIEAVASDGPWNKEFNVSLYEDGPFSLELPGGTTYALVILDLPNGQACEVQNGEVSGSVSDVAVICGQGYTVSGVVTGLPSAYTSQATPPFEVYLASDSQPGVLFAPAGNGPFTFDWLLLNGSSYGVSIYSQPWGEVCAVRDGSGTIGAANISSVEVACAAIACGTMTEGSLCCAGDTYHQCDGESSPLPDTMTPLGSACTCGPCGGEGALACAGTPATVTDRLTCNPGLVPTCTDTAAETQCGTCEACNSISYDNSYFTITATSASIDIGFRISAVVPWQAQLLNASGTVLATKTGKSGSGSVTFKDLAPDTSYLVALAPVGCAAEDHPVTTAASTGSDAGAKGDSGKVDSGTIDSGGGGGSGGSEANCTCYANCGIGCGEGVPYCSPGENAYQEAQAANEDCAIYCGPAPDSSAVCSGDDGS